MPTHSARSLFEQNITSAVDCLNLFDGVKALKTTFEADWILRAAIVFVVSAVDTYFHDKIRYRVGKYSLGNLPPALANLEVPISGLTRWDEATRKGNILRNWVTDELATKPLQSPNAIADALRLAGINSLWDTIEPNAEHKKTLLDELHLLVKRRNQIAHEGDRKTGRATGKKLRPIDRANVERAIAFAKDLVVKVETAFPA